MRGIKRSARFLLLAVLLYGVQSALIGKCVAKEVAFFSNLSMRDGLPSNIITAIAQDKYDFIWIATGSGLARYDGYDFKVFKKSESPNSLPSNELSALLACDDFLWVGTWNGLCKINIRTFKVTRIDLGEKPAIRALYRAKGNIIWIGTNDGLIRYSMEKDQYKLYTSRNSGLSHNTVRAIYEDDDGNLWVGTYNKLNKLPNKQERFIQFDLKGNYKPVLRNHLILDIQPDPASGGEMLWVGTETGLYKINARSGYFHHFAEKETGFSNEVIKCVYTDTDDNLWLGTDFGLNIFNAEKNSVEQAFHNPQLGYSLANNVIWQIFRDRSGLIWLVTSNGLSRINKDGAFYAYHEVSHVAENQPIGNQVRSVLISSTGKYWLGTLHGVIRIDPKANSRRIFDISGPGVARNNVFALEEDQFGRIWIGTAGGINIWDEKKQRMHAITASETNGLTSNYIGNFTKTGDGSFWVSAWEGGLYKVAEIDQEPGQLKFLPVRGLESGSEKNVWGNGSIWVIEFDELYRVDPKTFSKTRIESFSAASGKHTVYSLYFSRAGHLWAGVLNGMVQYLPEQQQSVFYPVITGNDVIVSAIIEDKNGAIWSASNTSLQKLDPSGGDNEKHVEIYPLEKDLPLKSFYYGCAAITESGEIIFGGDNGYIIFNPETAKPNYFNANVFITAIEINNRNVSIDEKTGGKTLLQEDIAFTDQLTLEYVQRSVTFEFSSLHYWQPSMNVFSYRLEGLETQWNFVSGSKNFAVYSNLPPGDYTFMVRGTNNYGIPGDQTRLLSFTVKPPLLLSGGFILLYILVVAAAIYYALKFYSGRVRLKNELKIIKMEKEHAEEIERTKEQFFTNISHELRTPISLILPPIHEVQKKGSLDPVSARLIGLAEKNSVRLLRLVNQILDFNKLEHENLRIKASRLDIVSFCREILSLFADQARRNDIDFRFFSERETCPLWVDAEKIEAVLFNLLSNAFKFTPIGGKIEVALDVSESQPQFKEGVLEIRVSDSGIGFSNEEKQRIFERFYQSDEGRKLAASSGIGLTIAAEYVKLHKGTIDVNSSPGKGSVFLIRLPLGKSHMPAVSADEKEASIASVQAAYVPKEEPDDQPRPGSGKPLLMIIEDNNDMIDFIRASLESRYDFITAQNGEEGFSKAGDAMPEVIISDIMMPVMDGLTLCKKVKSNPKTSHIAVILLTAKTLESQRLEGIRQGADVYITKPFEIDLLEAHIDNLLRLKKELNFYFRNELVNRHDKPEPRENVDNKFIKRFMDVVEANLSDPDFGVETISREIGMSATHLYRRIKSLTGRSPQEIIMKYRIKKASLLLQNNEGNVSEIMYKVGFSNLSYFSKRFREEFGVAPKEYQRKGLIAGSS